VTDELQLTATYGYTHAKFRDGGFVPFVPRNTLAIGATQRWALRSVWLEAISIHAGYHGAGRIYWTESNTGAKYPKAGGIMSGDNPKYGTTLGYFNAGYLKIRAITLGYDFAKLKAIKDLGISRLRVYGTIQNPFVLFSPFNNESGLDPETNSWATENTAVQFSEYAGKHKMPIVGYNTPATRNFLLGVNVTF
jgi:hypothetical protein